MKLFGSPEVQLHLLPGELVVTRKPQWVITILGSCVSITMFSRRFQLAAICHSMLPEPRKHDDDPGDPSRPFRYLSHAIPAMTAEFAQLKIPSDEVEVKMFGGANVIAVGGEPHDERWIGTANISMAQKLLKSAGYSIKAQNVGGDRGCKILFNTQNGDVLHKRLTKRNPVERRRLS